MILLLVEDMENTLDNISEVLHSVEHYNVIRCSSITKAKEAMKKNGRESDYLKKIDVIITDLNMSCTGLNSEALIKDSTGSRLAGWLWLTQFVFPSGKNADIDVIVYSDFLTILDARIANIKSKDAESMNVDEQLEITIYEKAKRIPKGTNVFNHDELIKALHELENKRRF